MVDTDRRKNETEPHACDAIDLEGLAAALSHDLRGTLSAAIGFNHIISKKLMELQAQDMMDYADLMKRACDSIDESILRLVDYLRLHQRWSGADKVELDAAVRDAAAYCVKTVGLSQAPAISGSAGPARACPHLLGIALVEVIHNAVQHGDSKEPVSIELSDTADGRPAVVVIDRGRGFHPDDTERAFAIFGHAHSGDWKGNAGMGLPICRRALGLIGGEMEIHTRPGEGCTVRMVLQRA